MKSQKCYQLSKIWKLLEIWTTKGFDSIATILPWVKPVQGVLPTRLQTLLYNLDDMHILYSNIWEDTTLQR
jgi:hypothetical protein